jgi:hypothetical protein
MRRAIATVLGGCVLAGLLTGCVGFAVPDDVATYDKQGDAGAAAGLGGILVRDSGCTYVEDPDSGTRVLPVFPSGSVTWSDDRLIVGNLSYAVGDTVDFGGGELVGPSNLDIRMPEACDPDIERFLVN